MTFNEADLFNFQRKVARYLEVLENTKQYRQNWQNELRDAIAGFLEQATSFAKLPAAIEKRTEIKNLEAVLLTLGTAKSGLGEPVGNGLHRDLIKQNGSLVYQQLFNGKVLVLINYPYIENYGQPQPPKTLAIYRPEELKEPYLIRHLEEFINETTKWEDYDDDAPEPNQRIGFRLNFEQEGKGE